MTYHALRANFYTNTTKQHAEERLALPAAFSYPDAWRGLFGVTLASAVLGAPIAGLYLDEPGVPGDTVGRADDEPDTRGMFPLYARGEWSEAPEPYAEVRELGSLVWFPEGAFLSVPCALLPRGEDAPAAYTLPVASWGAPEGMAAWTFKTLAWVASRYTMPRDGDSKGYTPIMDAALGSIDRHADERWHERVKRAAAWTLAREMHRVLTDWRAGGLHEREAFLERDGMLALDAAFCELLRGFGPEGMAFTDALQHQRRERRREQGESWRGWDLWLTLDEQWREQWGAPWTFPFLRYLGDMLWLDRVAKAFEVERERIELELELDEAAPLANRLRVVQEGGALYSQMSKVGGATAWGWGGTGDESSPLLEGFSVVPGLVRYLPHGAQLIPDARRPAHTQIPVGLDGVRLLLPSRGNRFVLTPTEGMLLLLVFATSQGARTDLGKLTRALNKGKARIQARDHERTAEALHTLRGLRLALPDKTDITLFSVRAPVMDGGPYEDREVSWCATDHLKQLQRGALPGAEALRLLNGSFVFNLSKALEFTGKEAAHLRAYMYACAMWNDAGCNQDKILAHTLEQWAAATNQLSPAAVEYLASEHREGSRQKLSDDKAAAWKVLEDLAGRGMLTIDGGKRSFKPLPTADHVAAFKKYGAQQADTLAFLGLNIDGC